MPEFDLLVVGSSVRAAASSARRAGFRCCAIDQFADDDLRAICPAIQSANYPDDLPGLAATMPPGPFLYTGAVENYPAVIEELARSRRLLGNSPAILHRVRSPWTLQTVLRAHHFAVPEIARTPDSVRGANWLCKPVRSGGGRGIVKFDPEQAAALQPADRSHFYLQESIEGLPYSALYVAAAGHSRLLGVTRQLIGTTWAGAAPFHYVGNVGPLRPPDGIAAELARLGNVFAAEFQLVGLFGVDLIVRDETFWPLEVNPRYTGAVEVLERGFACDAIRWHVEACLAGELPEPANLAPQRLHGKAIVFARQRSVCGPAFHAWLLQQNQHFREPVIGEPVIGEPVIGEPVIREPVIGEPVIGEPVIADVSPPGSVIGRGEPICTVFAAGESEQTVEVGLQQRAAEVLAAIALRPAPGAITPFPGQ